MVVSECHKKKRCKKNLDLDIQVQEDSYETFFFFLKLLWESHQTAFTTVSTINYFSQSTNSNKFLHMSCRTKCFANSYFPYTINKWNNLSREIRKSVSHVVYKSLFLKFVLPSPNNLFNVSDSLCINFLRDFI